MQYPFGFGLSYTEFEWKIDYLEHQNNATLSKNDIIKVGVTVTNTGDVAGQDVVQLYYTPEYKANGIEKIGGQPRRVRQDDGNFTARRTRIR